MTTSAFTCWRASASRSTFSVVVPPSTAMRLPAKSATRPMPASASVTMLAPSTKVIRLKSTADWRDSVQVVVLHSRSTRFVRTASSRFCTVSGTQRIFRSAILSCAPMPAAIARHRSTE